MIDNIAIILSLVAVAVTFIGLVSLFSRTRKPK